MANRRIEWSDSEMAIIRSAIAAGLTSADAHAELHRFGYPRSLEGTAAKLQQERHRMQADPYADEKNAEMLRLSISRRWAP